MVPSDVGDTQRADIDALFSFMLSRKPGNCYSVGSTQVLFGRFLVGEIDALFGVRIFSSEDPAISHGFNICFNGMSFIEILLVVVSISLSFFLPKIKLPKRRM